MSEKLRRWRRAGKVALRWLAVAVTLALLAGSVWLWWLGIPVLYRNAEVGPADRLKAITDTRTALFAGLAAIGAIATFWLNSRAQRFTAEALRNTAETVWNAQEGQLTDRYTKAIEQLGDDKTTAVRLGGLYALERLAVDFLREHPTVVEVISAFVRDRVLGSEPDGSEPSRQNQHEVSVLSRPSRLPTDIQAALTILGRLPQRTGIGRGNLSRANLPGADLTGANFTGAKLIGANLFRADLLWADLSKADLTRADLLVADFTATNLARANLTEANLTRADLTRTNLARASLTGADLTRANLSWADLTGANLARANLTGAYLARADLTSADLKGVQGLQQEQLDAALGAQDTSLPEGFLRPAHWRK